MESIEEAITFLGGPAAIWVLAAAYFSSVILERLWALRGNPEYNNKDALCSIGLNLINSVFGLLIGFLIPLTLYVVVFEQFRLFDTLALWLAIPLAFLIHELAYYWDHRLAHRVGLLWAIHSIHHSSNEFNHTTAARGFLIDPHVKTLFLLPAALIGIDPVVFVGVTVLTNAYGIWNHASWVPRLGWLDRVLMTPKMHKVHHANQLQYIDRNYSQVTLLFDYLFGTTAHIDEEPNPGLVKPTYDYNPLTAQFVGFRQLKDRIDTADRWEDKLAYLWHPPEWSHDGVCRSDCPKYANLNPA
ncbi:sterol desaturase/sphingolipid hydroxylase (fatty acid hydroxylase superfamily) [Erythromicrobium ramosum]|uniref:Sterol desaturase n=1 Tax=Erythrobacter ramosus TaxID=35811 RepID=A0A6I4UMI0_9SPHN|nr:sterol desaturase family protein [Erythrobacter ramosus]MBB3776879.1 sterol desaturase/sphingolipid hydroxylase (fatty acid hydroxylase superfamily) [Erythrobacter ramosus]MXP39888.1 sterol desaturase [Erythrobacter ramosus]